MAADGRDSVVFAGSARYPAARRRSHLATAGAGRAAGQVPHRDRSRVWRRHPRLCGGRARPGRSRAAGSTTRSSRATRRCTSTGSRTRSRRGWTIGWSAGCTAWRSRGAFFGESMFHRETDASKVALVALVERLRARGYVLLDTQWVTPHLEQFGAIEIPRADYLRRARARACGSTASSRRQPAPSVHGVGFAQRDGGDLGVEVLAERR